MSDIIEDKIKLKKEFINEQSLDEDVKENLKNLMKDKYKEKEKTTVSKYKKVIGIAACLVILSGATFAGNIGNFLSNLFANTEIQNDQIINPEAIVKINSEYVTNDGIGLNVSYLYEEGEFLYIVLNVQGVDNDVEDILVDEIEIKDLSNERIYSSDKIYNNFSAKLEYKKESKMIFIKIIKDEKINLVKNMELIIKNLKLEDKYISNNWTLKFKKP